tara:strand:- start:262 stop:1020 length:759 start_codon:yes stop_codon:yes gene_type:complete
MPDSKRQMLQARLQKRLRANELDSFEDYCDLLFAGEEGGQELIHMIDVVSTNKTDFFREPIHFEFLKSVALGNLTKSTTSPLKIWSAGCSSGEEPYTIAMVINEFLGSGSTKDFSILGTDISTSILKKAVNAIYTEERVSGIPLELKKQYFLRSKDSDKQLVRIVPKVRSKVKFQRLNFMDPDYPSVPMDFDIVFCRNVLIYFDKPTQERVINRLCAHLKPGGYFFLGHSESIMDMKVPLKQIKPTIYQKVN